jgi:hypothetical protein
MPSRAQVAGRAVQRTSWQQRVRGNLAMPQLLHRTCKLAQARVVACKKDVRVVCQVYWNMLRRQRRRLRALVLLLAFPRVRLAAAHRNMAARAAVSKQMMVRPATGICFAEYVACNELQ